MSRAKPYFRAVVWCGHKQALDCGRLTLAEAKGRVRAQLEKHGAKVSAWFIYDETEATIKQVAGCDEVAVAGEDEA